MKKVIISASMLLLALSSCSSPPPSGLLTGGGYKIWVNEPVEGQMEAIVAGTIYADENGCIRLDLPDEDNPLIAWVSGTTINDDGVITSNGRDYTVGDHLVGGGGFVPGDSPIEGCVATTLAVVNPDPSQ